MATLPPKRCSEPGCAAILQAPARRCERHQRKTQPASADRSEYHKANGYFYSSALWRKFRSSFLRANPFCVGYKCDCVDMATVVDHIIPISEGGARLNSENCQSLCATCHGKKTADEQSIRGKGGGDPSRESPVLPCVKVKKNRREFLGMGSLLVASSGNASDRALEVPKRRLL